MTESTQMTSIDPDQYVRENRETLVEVIKHANDDFVRALYLAALIEFGDEPDREQLRRELARMEDLEGAA